MENIIDVCIRSWLELPEALTALLITLPYLFTTVAFPGVPGPVSRTPTTLSEAVADSSPPIETSHTLRGSPLQQALALSAATLVAVGAVGKVSFTTQPLDRRKEAAGYGDTKSTLKRAVKDALGVILPFYAAAQLGGAKAALVLLLCLAAGVGSVELKPGKHTFWNNLQRTVRTRKFTSGALIVGTIVDCFAATFSADTLLGYGALWTSIMLVPPPLPTSVTSLSIKSTSSADDSFSQSRATLPRPASSLVNSAENIIATILSGFFLTVVFSLYSCFSAPALPQTLFAKLFFVLSVASATALYVYSLPLHHPQHKTKKNNTSNPLLLPSQLPPHQQPHLHPPPPISPKSSTQHLRPALPTNNHLSYLPPPTVHRRPPIPSCSCSRRHQYRQHHDLHSQHSQYNQHKQCRYCYHSHDHAAADGT